MTDDPESLAELYLAERLADPAYRPIYEALLLGVHAALHHPEGLQVCVNATVEHLIAPFRFEIQALVTQAARQIHCSCGADGIPTRIDPNVESDGD